MWLKFFGVVGNFATCALTGGTIAEVHGDPRTQAVLLGLTSEAIAIARAHGFTDLGFDIEKLRKNPPTSPHKPSMLQDLERGRAIELDTSYLIVQDLARQIGLPTPTHDTVVPLLALRARLVGCIPDASHAS
jgi:2-dehydropantoate 2-reductase